MLGGGRAHLAVRHLHCSLFLANGFAMDYVFSWVNRFLSYVSCVSLVATCTDAPMQFRCSMLLLVVVVLHCYLTVAAGVLLRLELILHQLP